MGKFWQVLKILTLFQTKNAILTQTHFQAWFLRKNVIITYNEKSKDYCKADLKQRVLFYITIFRLAIPAFRFTDVTELM